MTSYLRFKTDGAGKKSRKKKRLRRMAKRGVCGICGKGMDAGDVSLDHILPKSKGGSNEAWNLRPTHKKCNWNRGNTMEDTVEVRNAERVHRMFGMI